MSWSEISWPRKKEPVLESRLERKQQRTHDGNSIQLMPGISNSIPADPEGCTLDLVSPNGDITPDIDDYLQMANDFSNYLTWDPWNFGYA